MTKHFHGGKAGYQSSNVRGTQGQGFKPAYPATYQAEKFVAESRQAYTVAPSIYDTFNVDELPEIEKGGSQKEPHNVSVEIRGSVVYISVPLMASMLIPSASGKSKLLATTYGYSKLAKGSELSYSLNVMLKDVYTDPALLQPSRLGDNVAVAIQDSKLILRVDTAKRLRESSTGKSDIVATAMNQRIPGSSFTVSLTVVAKKAKAEKQLERVDTF